MFSAFSLFLVALYGAFYTEIQREFQERKNYDQVALEQVREQLHEERLRYKILAEEHLSFKHSVAETLPTYLEELQGEPEKSYPVRNLASLVLTSKALGSLEDRQSQMINSAKQHFKDGHYEQAADLMKDFIRSYETSSRVIEAQFLLAESQYQNKNYEESLAQINRMLTLYPDNELTGFLLLRLGAIFEDQYRDSEARRVYETITENFHNQDLVFQAQRNLQRLSL